MATREPLSASLGLNRLGVTEVIDAGGGFQNYPDDDEIIARLAADGELTLRIAYNLFMQKAGEELEDFTRWGRMVSPGQGDDRFRQNGAGEMLVFSAADFEDFREPAARDAAGHGGPAGIRGAQAGGEPLALADARHLRRDHHRGAQRLRAGQLRPALRRAALVLRPRRDGVRAAPADRFDPCGAAFLRQAGQARLRSHRLVSRAPVASGIEASTPQARRSPMRDATQWLAKTIS